MPPRRVLVTGASRGIGKAIAKTLAAEGWVVLTPTRAQLDLSEAKSVQAFIESGACRDLDGLVNNAGENKINTIDRIAFADWQRTQQVNLGSAFLLLQASAPGMASRGWGRIVNISSIYSGLARGGRAAYSASKAGLDGLTRTAAIEFGPRNVLVNSVAPGFVDTELTRQNNTPAQIKDLAQMTAVKRMADPAEISAVVSFLMSERNTFVTGQTLIADGGFSCQ